MTKLKCPHCNYTYRYRDRKKREKKEFLFHDKLYTINIDKEHKIEDVIIPLWECPNCNIGHINWKYYHKYVEKKGKKKKNV